MSRAAMQQEPVAWASSLDFDDDDQEIIPAKDKGKLGTSNCDIPLYTAPPNQSGMSLRDYFAAKAMQALARPGNYFDATAKQAYMAADAMLKARDR